jgi:hypothetical protein
MSRHSTGGLALPPTETESDPRTSHDTTISEFTTKKTFHPANLNKARRIENLPH